MAPNGQAMLSPRQLNDADEAILDELHRGRASPSYLSDQTGIEQTYINQRLRRLDEHGHVNNLARGLWELADDPRGDNNADSDSVDELRGRLQNAFETRDDALARADRLEAKLEDCREELNAARSESGVDTTHLRRLVDDLEAACERGDGNTVQSTLEQMRELVADA
ncbi:MAG: DNA-binding Lrp family transcriptional regulator [Haloarculaceae archaeon]|jgi:DNA-binding Lrp family transcriptional regulator